MDRQGFKHAGEDAVDEMGLDERMHVTFGRARVGLDTS